MSVVTVSPKFQVVIPREIREALRRVPGQKVQVLRYQNRVEFFPVQAMRKMEDRMLNHPGIHLNIDEQVLPTRRNVLPLCDGGNTVANPMRTVSFKVPVALDDALSELARRRRSSRSALVREALEGLTTGGRRSVTAVVDELVGHLDGPSDLSTNPKHLRGYGK